MTTAERADETKLLVKLICAAGIRIVTAHSAQICAWNLVPQQYWGVYSSAVDTHVSIFSSALGPNSDSVETSRQTSDTTNMLFEQDGQKQGKVFSSFNNC